MKGGEIVQTKGMLIKCDNCCGQIFLERKEDTILDGGYTSVENYENLPPDWKRVYAFYRYIDLCPKCSENLESIIRREALDYVERIVLDILKKQDGD